jgi:hypothetical protein
MLNKLVSSAYQKVLGQSPEKIPQARAIADLAVSDEKESRLTQRREAYQHEFRLSMPEGSEKWLSAHADIRSDRIFGVSFDVTKRKQLEHRAKELTEQLVRIQEDERQKISRNCTTLPRSTSWQRVCSSAASGQPRYPTGNGERGMTVTGACKKR